MDDSADQIELRSMIQSGYRYALSLTHHRHDAEDLVQQACLKILRNRSDLASKNYLFCSIRNLFIDSGRRRSESSLSESVREQMVDPTQNHVADVSRQMEINQLLAGLKPEEREALYLSCVEGYTAAEISELTGQRRGTVLSHIARAKKRAFQRHGSPDHVEIP